MGSRLRASDIDFPREMKVQYSDSSFDGNNVVNWLDDVALTNAISIVDNEVREPSPASSSSLFFSLTRAGPFRRMGEGEHARQRLIDTGYGADT